MPRTKTGEISKEARYKMGWRRGLTLTAYRKECEGCGKTFTTIPSQDARFCSNGCKFEWMRRNRVKYYCKWCKEVFKSFKSAGRKYCSTACKIASLAEARRKRYRHKRIYGIFRDRKELKQYLLSIDSRCWRCGWDECLEVLEIHHRDRNHKNNTKENVDLLCPNCHSIEHYKKRDGQFKNNIGRPLSRITVVKENESIN